jgi:hypothetical protein
LRVDIVVTSSAGNLWGFDRLVDSTPTLFDAREKAILFAPTGGRRMAQSGHRRPIDDAAVLGR